MVLPLLQQSILIWQVSLGYLILGKRLTPAEVCLPAWLTVLLYDALANLPACIVTHAHGLCMMCLIVIKKIKEIKNSACKHVLKGSVPACASTKGVHALAATCSWGVLCCR